MEPEWLRWARELQAIARIGPTYAIENHFDRERDDLTCGETGYATPTVDVRGVVFRDDRILLVREIADGRWTLPGGWAEVNDPAQLRRLFEHHRHPEWPADLD